MKVKAAIPKRSASLLLLRRIAPHKLSLFNYELLVLQRMEKLSFGSGLVFPGGKVEPAADEQYCRKFGLRSDLHSAALRECFEETGLHFTEEALLESERMERLGRVRLQYIADEFNLLPAAKGRAFQELSQLLPPSRSIAPFMRLITVPEIRQRYDTTFFAHAVEDYRFVNFFKYAEHEKHLHALDKVVHCEREFVNFRWMTPAEILEEHFGKKALVHPPQFILLNIMLAFRQREEFMAYLRSFPPQRNLNLAPNIVTLIPNQHPHYPYAATLIGDAEFPFSRIISNEQAPELQEEMRDWQQWQQSHIPNCRNRFLFKEGKAFFQSEYGVDTNAPASAVKDMKDWEETHRLLEEGSFK